MADTLEKLSSITRFERTQYGERIVDTNTSASRFKKIKKDINDSLELFSELDITGDKKAALEKHVNKAKLRIVQSYLKLTFIEQFAEELDSDSAVALLAQVSNIIGEIDDDTEQQVLKTKLNDMGRRTEQSEPFASYLKRITTLAEKLKCDVITQKYLAASKFVESLSPIEVDFALIHGGSGDSAQQKAELLDKKKQHIYKPVVKEATYVNDRFMQLEQSHAEILSKVECIADKLCNTDKPAVSRSDNTVEQCMEQLRLQNAALMQCMQVQHNAQSHRGRPGGSRGSHRGGSYRGAYGNRGGGQRDNKRCYHCGLFNHEEKDCYTKNNPSFKCIKCKEAGHSQHSPKFHPEMSKN